VYSVIRGRISTMAEKHFLPDAYEEPHPGHRNHLCVMHVFGFVQTNLEDFKKLIRNGTYVCRQCGRVATDAGSLCEPESL
jgi:hypothetical protein